FIDVYGNVISVEISYGLYLVFFYIDNRVSVCGIDFFFQNFSRLSYGIIDNSQNQRNTTNGIIFLHYFLKNFLCITSSVQMFLTITCQFTVLQMMTHFLSDLLLTQM